MFQGQPVEQADQYKYLGLIFDDAKGFSTAPGLLAAAGRRALCRACGPTATSTTGWLAGTLLPGTLPPAAHCSLKPLALVSTKGQWSGVHRRAAPAF